MWDNSGIYAPGPIQPIVKHLENIAVWTNSGWEYYQVEYIEGMPRSSPIMPEMVGLAGVTTLAANGTLSKQVITVLQMNDLELLHLRWAPIENVEGVLWERAGQVRFNSRGVVARVTRDTEKYDPYLATTTFWVLGNDRDMNLEVRNPMGVAIPACRFAFWGWRYVLRDLALEIPADAKAALKRGDTQVVRQIFGPVTYIPAEGRTA